MSAGIRIITRMKNFFRSAAFLAAAGLVAKVIGALYKIPLVTVLGAEGMGIYQLVFPAYTTLLALSSGGIPQAVSRSTARALAVGNTRESRRILTVSVLSLAAAGLAGSLIMALGGAFFARLQGNPLAAAAYVALAPSVLFVSLLAALRGWWQGRNNMFPTAASQLVEQVVKLGAGLFFAAALMPYGVECGVAGAAIGITASEALALLALAVGLLARRRNETPEGAAPPVRAVLSDVYGSALPISFGSLVLPLLQLIDSVMIVNILVAGGMPVAEATSLYGAAGAPVSAIVNLPAVVTSAVAAALMPRFSAALKRGERADGYVAEGMKYAHVVGLGGSAALCLFARPLVTLLYSSGLTPALTEVAASVLRVSSVSVMYVCYMQIATTYLQAAGRAYVPAVNLLIGGALKAVLTALLLPLAGMTGSAAASVAAYAVTFALDAAAARDGLRGIPARPFAMCALSAAAACLAGGAVLMLPLPPVAATLTALAAFGTVYLAALAAAGVLHPRELLSRPVKINAAAGVKKSKKY